MEIRGKTALVTGGAKRIGREIALSLAQKGAHIYLHYNTSRSEAEATASEIKSLGVECRLFQADLGKSVEVLKMAKEIFAQSRTVDILINNASVFYRTPLKTVKESDWDTLMNINLKGPFILCKEIGLKMAESGGGRIINIADWSGLRPYKDYLPYCTSKGGLITLTKALARDLAPKVTANAIAPGAALFPWDFPEDEKKKAVEKIPLGHEGSPRDIAHAVVFLAESDYINGLVLSVDGGRSIN